MQMALVVRRETHIPAAPAAVFALLADPEKIHVDKLTPERRLPTA